MGHLALTPALLERIADRFKALSEPARLHVLSTLRSGERTVGEIGEETGLTQTNLSKHLQVLHRTGFVTRRRDGLHVIYALAGDDVSRLCDLMCGRIEQEARTEAQLVSAPRSAARSKRARKALLGR
jgi:DNA-binding transcriptional ArsR family regulator